MINIRSEHAADREFVTISGSLTVEHASEIKDALQEALGQKAKNIVLSLGAVTGADLSFFQVLCAAHKTATTYGKFFSVEQFRQDVLIRAHRGMGFTRRIGCALDKTRSCVFMLMSNQ